MMNKIEVISEKEILNELDNVVVSGNDDCLTINIKGMVENPIVLINKIFKKIIFMIDANVNVTILEIKDTENDGAFIYRYNVSDNSTLTINKFYYMGKYNEKIEANLDGYEANMLLNLSSMSFDNQQYDITVNHNNKKTISNIINHGVIFGDSNLNLIVNGIVKKGMTDSVLNQDNKIMTMGTGKGTIKPNLYIDENMVTARHGASIGRFNEDEIFYLESRGIPRDESYHLLIKGFLLGNLKLDDDNKEKLSNIIEKYGR